MNSNDVQTFDSDLLYHNIPSDLALYADTLFWSLIILNHSNHPHWKLDMIVIIVQNQNSLRILFGTCSTLLSRLVVAQMPRCYPAQHSTPSETNYLMTWGTDSYFSSSYFPYRSSFPPLEWYEVQPATPFYISNLLRHLRWRGSSGEPLMWFGLNLTPQSSSYSSSSSASSF